MSPLKQAIEAYIATPTEDEARRADLFEAIEQHIYAEFEAEDDMTEDKLAQIDVTEMAHTLIARADY
jgi:hypothetical protein